MRYLSASSGVLTAARPLLLRTRLYLPTHYPPPTRFGGSLCGAQSTAAPACPQPSSLTSSPRHHRADTRLGEELEQQRVRRAPVDDVRERNPIQRSQARLELRDHPPGHLARLDAMPRVLARQHRHHVAVDPEHALDVGQENELGGAQGQRDLGGHGVCVHLPGEHHLHDFHRLVVCDAEAVLELGLQAEPLAHRRDLGSTAMYENRLHADVAEQHDVEQRLVPCLLERIASDLDHDDLAVESLDVRQRLDEDFRSLLDCQCHVVYSAFIRTYSSDKSQPQASALPSARPSFATISISDCSNARRTAVRSTSTPAPRSKTTSPPMLRWSLSRASSAPL